MQVQKKTTRRARIVAPFQYYSQSILHQFFFSFPRFFFCHHPLVRNPWVTFSNSTARHKSLPLHMGTGNWLCLRNLVAHFLLLVVVTSPPPPSHCSCRERETLWAEWPEPGLHFTNILC
ncbi:hypothetical protein AGOR_G00012460 [Albula goreensis]|uniref:Uncharacterized protein n=1 Tax=Albula goreensis TaxID=1534307 RepID=A0A8T3E6M6_9TELE|nr:hypothetical protein AGOR_G00012460 [Albula goreensis]